MLSRRVNTPLWSVVVLFALAVVLATAAYLGAVSYFHAEQASQQRQGRAFEVKLCTTLNGLAQLTPPAGATPDNPSRAYLVKLHARLAELGPDVGCKPGR